MNRTVVHILVLCGLTTLIGSGLNSPGIMEARIAHLDSPNQAPIVDAGPNQTIGLFHNTAPLDGTVTDDGLPSGTVTITWVKVSGPGRVTFGDAAAVDTIASFILSGTYVLRLTADDGALSTNAQVTITYNDISLVQVPDARGIWTGLLSRTLSNCPNPANNRSKSGSIPIILVIQTQEGAAFTSEGAFQLDLVEGAFAVNLLLRNSVSVDGVFAGRGSFEFKRVSDNAAGGSGVVNLTGTLSGNHLTFTRFDGPIGGDGCRFTATASLNRSRAAIPYPIGLSINNPRDFTRDIKADLLWQNTLTGTVVIWEMNGSAVNNFGYSGTVPAPWKIMGIGDVNGDGQADVVLQNQNSHTVAIWFMEMISPVSVGFPGSVSPEWKLKAVGDLNGDTKADLIWVNTNTGQVGIWLMNRHAIADSRVLNPVAGDWASWQLKGVEDVDANGKGDVIWHNSSTGQVAVWLMDGTSIASMGFPGVAPTDWEMAGFGDFDGYGTTDIVWRNTVNGAVTVWFMNGGTIGSVSSLGGVPLEWHIAQVADGNGDEKDDVVWHHDNGTVAVWLMNGTAIESVGFPGGVGPGWKIQPQN